ARSVAHGGVALAGVTLLPECFDHLCALIDFGGRHRARHRYHVCRIGRQRHDPRLFFPFFWLDRQVALDLAVLLHRTTPPGSTAKKRTSRATPAQGRGASKWIPASRSRSIALRSTGGWAMSDTRKKRSPPGPNAFPGVTTTPARSIKC